MSTLVTEARYNALRARIQKILGPSLPADPQFGYGQTLTSNSVIGNFNLNQTNTSLIESAQYRNLYIDLVRARVHQIGTAAFTQQPFVVGDFDLNGAATDKVRETYIQGLESLMTSIETDKFLIFDAQQGSLEPLKSASNVNIEGFRLQAAGTWNRTLSFIFTVTFASDSARRQFFNAGGQIRISSRHEGSEPNTKTTAWKTLLSSVGQVSFAANRTYSTLTFGTGSSIGNYNLTSTYQLVYRGVSSTYSGNAFEVYALQNSSTQIQFRVYLADTRVEGTDEAISGDYYVTANLIRPEGNVVVNGVATPTVVISPPPIGAIVSNLTQI